MPKTLETIAKELNLDAEQTAIVEKLLELNENRINPTVLRAHLSKGYGTCRSLAIDLVDNGLATPTESGSGMKWIDSRSQGFMRN